MFLHIHYITFYIKKQINVENFLQFDKTSYFLILEKYGNRYIMTLLKMNNIYNQNKERRIYGEHLSKKGQEINLRNK